MFDQLASSTCVGLRLRRQGQGGEVAGRLGVALALQGGEFARVE